ncbi:MAG TPA: protoporphyrinogen oxidase HemJ [Geminicoccaceae bacterium]
MSDPALWLKALHIMGFTAWMAGLWYLPRLFIYHHGVAPGSEASERFKVMERRLLRAITTPAMAATWLLGIALALVQDAWTEGWLHAKLLLVVGLSGAHGMMARYVRAFAEDARPRDERYFRIFNEVPTLLFVGVVILVIFKPF